MRRPFTLFWGGRAHWQTKKKNIKPDGDIDRTHRGKVFSSLLALWQANRRTAAQSRVKTCGRAVESGGMGWRWGDGGEDESFVVPMLNELENTIELLWLWKLLWGHRKLASVWELACWQKRGLCVAKASSQGRLELLAAQWCHGLIRHHCLSRQGRGCWAPRPTRSASPSQSCPCASCSSAAASLKLHLASSFFPQLLWAAEGRRGKESEGPDSALIFGPLQKGDSSFRPRRLGTCLLLLSGFILKGSAATILSPVGCQPLCPGSCWGLRMGP